MLWTVKGLYVKTNQYLLPAADIDTFHAIVYVLAFKLFHKPFIHLTVLLLSYRLLGFLLFCFFLPS